jgi:hypothetical protein
METRRRSARHHRSDRRDIQPIAYLWAVVWAKLALAEYVKQVNIAIYEPRCSPVPAGRKKMPQRRGTLRLSREACPGPGLVLTDPLA